MGRIIALIIGALSGSAMTFQGCINSELGEKTGPFVMALIVQLVGFIAALLLFLVSASWRRWGALAGVPWYSIMGGGVIGVAIIIGVAYTIPKTGAALGISAILIAQLLTALLCDHFGLFTTTKTPLTWMRLVGTALMIVGARLLVVKGK
ncbi:MAG: DMT family transporter [Bacillota bacterium]